MHFIRPAIICLVVICFTRLASSGQHIPVPALHTSSDSLVLYLDGQKDEFTGINKLGSQFKYDFVVEKDSIPFALVSKSDSISLILKQKKNNLFRIVRETKGDTVTCIFTIRKWNKPAAFSDRYKREHDGKTIIETPEVYELTNIIFALTEYGKTNAIYKDTPYYQKVIDHFSSYKQEPAVRTIDSLLRSAPEFYYLHLKMDSYAYVFSGTKISNGGVYDRIATGDKNQLDDYIPLLEAFAAKSRFREFYQKNGGYYAGLRKDYKANIEVAAMKSWLEKQFPATRYSAIKVIFSPLVGWNQSAGFFNDNGFTEAQAHVNYPFATAGESKQPADVQKGRRMMIAFTEINHAYLNPEAEKYGQAVAAALKELPQWTTPGTPSAGYNNAMLCFEEYMNYGLVTLYYSDILGKASFETLKSTIEKSMSTQRGFQRFGAFNEELLRLYRNRKPGQTVADLYPAIIDWAGRHP